MDIVKLMQRLQLTLSLVSWSTVVLILVRGLSGWSGPAWFSFWVFPVMIAAAVGYLTNYIAIEMLFKPYERSGFHWLRLATLGVWRQGLVPANKARIGRILGEEIPERLLQPENISREVGRRVSAMASDPELLDQLRAAAQHLVRRNQETIIAFLLPRTEESLRLALDENLTPENLRHFWDEILAGHLESPENRARLASGIVSGLKSRTPELRELLRDLLREGVRRYVNDRLRFIPKSGDIASGLVNYLDWDDIERQIAVRLEDESVRRMIVQELAHQSDRLRDWLHSDHAAPELEAFLGGAKQKLEGFLHGYLAGIVPQMTSRILSSDALWDWVRGELIPALQRYLDFWMARDGRRVIVEMLDLNNRIEQSVARQNVREFHAMINRVAAEHLGAIQVLGYILGAVIGLLQQIAVFLAG